MKQYKLENSKEISNENNSINIKLFQKKEEKLTIRNENDNIENNSLALSFLEKQIMIKDYNNTHNIQKPFTISSLFKEIEIDNKEKLLFEIFNTYIFLLPEWIQIIRNNLYNKIWQAYAALLPIKTVGVMGDSRTYENICILRDVISEDGMTADY